MKNEIKIYVGACILAMYLALLVCLSAGCSTGQTSRGFSDAAYGYSTNVVATLRRDLLPYVPPPYNGLLEGALAVSTGLLGLWGARLHKNVTALNGAVNGKNVVPGPAKS